MSAFALVTSPLVRAATTASASTSMKRGGREAAEPGDGRQQRVFDGGATAGGEAHHALGRCGQRLDAAQRV
ncbi:hypothetical protein, partial [Streptomyces sp. PU-14G]|uniref:hypothetical protein n=1 Tax=Streptomyces sp. PU-14G TaxID=2800808 RepID=UPI0034DEA753